MFVDRLPGYLFPRFGCLLRSPFAPLLVIPGPGLHVDFTRYLPIYDTFTPHATPHTLPHTTFDLHGDSLILLAFNTPLRTILPFRVLHSFDSLLRFAVLRSFLLPEFPRFIRPVIRCRAVRYHTRYLRTFVLRSLPTYLPTTRFDLFLFDCIVTFTSYVDYYLRCLILHGFVTLVVHFLFLPFSFTTIDCLPVHSFVALFNSFSLLDCCCWCYVPVYD